MGKHRSTMVHLFYSLKLLKLSTVFYILLFSETRCTIKLCCYNSKYNVSFMCCSIIKWVL